MKDQAFEIIRGGGNIYRDFGDTNADLKQLKAILAAAIIRAVEKRSLSVRKAEA